MKQPEQGQKEELFLPDNLENCHAELSETRRELEETKDKYLRAAAQGENQRNLLRQLLEVMDNLDRALAQPTEPAVLYQGVQLTRMQLRKVLTQAGVKQISVEPGQPFDPTYHEGVDVRFGDVNQPTVAAATQPGYLYENELLRPASVVVVRPID